MSMKRCEDCMLPEDIWERMSAKAQDLAAESNHAAETEVLCWACNYLVDAPDGYRPICRLMSVSSSNVPTYICRWGHSTAFVDVTGPVRELVRDLEAKDMTGNSPRTDVH